MSLSEIDFRQLRTIIPRQCMHGWQGTLVETRTKALRDDTTVISKPGTTNSKPTASTTSSTTGTTASASYRGYPYYPIPPAGNQANYYPSFYPNTASTTPGTPATSSAPYPYPAWNYTYAGGQKTSNTTTPTILPNYNPSYYPTSSLAAPRAVANTAKATAQAPANGWVGSAALPNHLRRSTTVTASTPLKQVQHAPSTPT